MPPKNLLLMLIGIHTAMGLVMLLIGASQAGWNEVMPKGTALIQLGTGMIAFGAGIAVAGAMWTLAWRRLTDDTERTQE